jgi:predicted DNA binding protein
MLASFRILLSSCLLPSPIYLYLAISDAQQPTVKEIDAELVWEEQEMKEKMEEKWRVVQERKAALEKAAEEEKVRKAEEERLKAKVE